MFRGKTPSQDELFDNGEWVQGFYTCFNGKEYRIYNGYAETDCGDYYPDWFNVRPETVGQYTGLTDKNGKKVFEGDILSFSDRLVYVNWPDYCGCWDCSYIKAVKGKATLHEYRSPNKWRYNAVVIGNIHDNPELLKGGTEA